jgi:hypothetical protein
MNIVERARRRNMCLSLSRSQRYRILKKWTDRHMEINPNEELETIFCDFAIAMVCLGLTYSDVMYLSKDSKNWYAKEEKPANAIMENFLYYLAEESRLYFRSFISDSESIEDIIVSVMENKLWESDSYNT